jgi:hypothetical protein
LNDGLEAEMRAPAAATAIDRRSLLAGAGVVAVGGLLVGRSSPADPLGPVVVEKLHLFASDLRHVVPGAEPGELPPLDAPAVPRARLEHADGTPAGTLASVAVPSTDGNAVLHTFTLNDGTILGIGPSDLAGPHALVGGSGAYAGLSGSYGVRPHRDGHVVTFELRRGAH